MPSQNSLSDPTTNKMVFTNSQTTAFFENVNQMAIPHATVVKLAEEGILNCLDLTVINDTPIKLTAYNLKQMGGRVTNPNYSTATITTPPFVFGVKSQQRLNMACNLICYNNMVGRLLTESNLQWSCTMYNFKDLWQALKDRKLWCLF